MANTSIKLTDIPLASNISINSKLLAVDFDIEKTELITTRDLIVYLSNTVSYVDKINTAYEYANSALITANNAYSLSLISYDLSNSVYDIANSVYEISNLAFIQANSAYDMANSSFDLANNTATLANSAEIIVLNNYNSVNNMYVMTNSIALQVNSHYALSNSISLQSSFSADRANNALSVANVTFDLVNSISFIANTAYGISNVAINTANIAINTSNTALLSSQSVYSLANTIYEYANTISIQIDSSYDTTNTIYDLANTIYLIANNSYTSINSSFDVANSAYLAAVNAFDTGNTAGLNANSALNFAYYSYDVANNAYDQANNAYLIANTFDIVYNTVNSAFDTANTKFSSSGGTITGNVTVTGSVTIEHNLSVLGNVTTISANNLSIKDNMIYLNESLSGNTNPDLGFAGAYNDGIYHHAGFFRDATDGFWKVFDNYKPEPAESVWIDTSNNTFRLADFQANNISANTFVSEHINPIQITSNQVVANLNSDLLDGYQASYFIDYTSNSFDQANTGVIQAQAAFFAANNVGPQIEPAFNQANTGVIQAQAAFFAANNVGPQIEPAFNQANTGVIQAQAAFSKANTADTNAANASFLTVGTIPTARLASGSANSVTYLRGDQTWHIPGPVLTIDNSTNGTFYPGMTTGSDEIWANAYISSSKLSFNPSTGTLSSTLLNAISGFSYNGSASSGNYLRGNGTSFVESSIQAADVPTLNQNTTGSSGSCTGNAATATALQTARTIGGVSFNGTANINLPGVNTAGNQNTSGTAYNITQYTINQSVGTGNNVQFNSIGVNTAGSGTAGEIRATNNITAYYSDERLKTRMGLIDNALEKVLSLDGFYYKANETAQSLGYESIKEVGVSAQQVQKVLPEIVVPAPIDDKYLTVRYEKLIPLLIEAIKEQQEQIDSLKNIIENIK